MDITAGRLSLELDTGLVTLSLEDEASESCGFVGDGDNCPPGLEADWECLLDRWNDSRGGGHRREAERAFYFGLDPACWN